MPFNSINTKEKGALVKRQMRQLAFGI